MKRPCKARDSTVTRPALQTAVRSRRSGLALHPPEGYYTHGLAAPDWLGEIRVGPREHDRGRAARRGPRDSEDRIRWRVCLGAGLGLRPVDTGFLWCGAVRVVFFLAALSTRTLHTHPTQSSLRSLAHCHEWFGSFFTSTPSIERRRACRTAPRASLRLMRHCVTRRARRTREDRSGVAAMMLRSRKPLGQVTR